MFKGYVKTSGKRPLEKTKGRTQFHSLAHVQSLNCDYAGILNDDVIQIDLDDTREAQTVHKIILDQGIRTNILQTSRGLHFYFKNPGIRKRSIKKQTALGVTVDTGLGLHNCAVPLRIDGGQRSWIGAFSDHLDVLPIWLRPIGNMNIDFFNMGDGDGRNDALFKYILTLRANNLSVEETRQTIKIINTYILKEPLSEGEIETILRDEAFDKETFFEESRFLHDVFGDYLIKNEHIVNINDALHVYDGGIYTMNKKSIMKTMLKHIRHLKTTQRIEVFNYLEINAPVRHESALKYVGVKNGVLDMSNMTLIDDTPNIVLLNKINAEYREDAKCAAVDQVLDTVSCHDKELRGLIEEMIGYCLFRRNELGKSFILTGKGANGKSTLLKMVKNLVGKKNASSLGLGELHSKFKTAELVGKLVNLGDDISSEYITDDSVFKKLVTGETVTAERKGKDPFEFENYSKLIFSANEIPRINDKSDGLKRRLVIIPFDAKLDKSADSYDPFIIDKVTSPEGASYLLNLAIAGLKRVLERHEFSASARVEAENKEFEIMNNPILEFFAELEGVSIVNKTNRDLYARYSTWCVENNYKPTGMISFSREVCSHFGVKTMVKKLEGKCVRVYVTGDTLVTD